MVLQRRTIARLLVCAAWLLVGVVWFVEAAHASRPSAWPERVEGQEQAPTRREIALTARNYRFSPSRIEVRQDDLVTLTIQSEDVAYSLTIDEYRVSRRVPAGGMTTLQFRADRAGTFTFYSNLTSDARHSQMKGELIVRSR
jgi:heme/copper-type cytochrome/quinol oxidase subunit 2